MSAKTFATFAQVRREVTKLPASDTPAKVTQSITDDYIWDTMREVGGRMERVFQDWDFEPVLETRYYDAYGQHIYRWDNVLMLEAPLLAATEVIDADGTTLTQWDGTRSTRNDANQFEPVAVNTGRTPYIFLRRLDQTWAAPTDNFGQIEVTGYWGFGRQGLNFEASGDTVLNAPLAADGREITVALVTGEDYFFDTPRFSQGNLLRMVSDSGTDFARVLDIAGTDTLKVERGANGTTAVAHIATTPIDIWYPEPVIVRAVSRWVAYLVSKRTRFSSAVADGLGGTTKYPVDIPVEVQNILKEYNVATKLKAPRAV